MIVNQSASFERLSLSKLRNTIKILKNVGSRSAESRKAWFIEIDKIFEEKNLKIFYLPVSALQKVIASRTYTKLPDPKKYLIGLSFLPPGHESRSDIFRPEESAVHTRKTSTSRNRAALQLDTSLRSPFNLTSKRKSVMAGFGTPQVGQMSNYATWDYKQ